MLAVKLALVAASVLLATLAARRFGHAVAGTLAGMPVIAGPIMGFVLLQATPGQSRDIALATLTCLPASILHMTAFAHAARRWPWPAALLLANGLLVAAAALLLALRLPEPAAIALALAAPLLGLAAMPRARSAPGAVAIPRTELVLRVAAAVLMAWAIVQAAGSLPPMVSGVLLAVPIAGNVLPCFTLPRHGADATVTLMAGFVRGLMGFAAFFVTLVLALGRLSPGAAYALAWTVALATALAVRRAVLARQRQAARQPATG